MIRTTFKFGAEFRTELPNVTHVELTRKLQGLPGVVSVEPGVITERCPLAHMQVHVEVEDDTSGERLLRKISKVIDGETGVILTSRERSLSDLFGT